MPVSTGLTVQPSRFAAIALDSDSDSEKESGWHQVPQGKNKNGAKSARGRGQGGKQEALPTGAAGDEGKGLSKNAKKRARKKRNQSSSAESADGGGAQGGIGAQKGDGYLEHWKESNAKAAEKDFQKDLEEAILQSTLEAEHQSEISKERQATLAAIKAAELAATKAAQLAATKEAQLAATKEAQLAATKAAKSKKSVTMTLQELHRTTPISPPPSQEVHVWSPPSEAKGDSPTFFSQLDREVQLERRKEERKKEERRVEEPQQPVLLPAVEESARVAHLMDEQEKRDKTIADLKRNNETLKTALREVKERNRSLCKILSQGEFSIKAQLLQQIDDLSTVKNELTTEIESLHSSLEQERSRNKAMKSEITRLQGIAAVKGATSAKK